MSAPRVDANRFWRDGYLLIKSVFTGTEVDAFRRHAYETIERDRQAGRVLDEGGVTCPLGDLLSKDGLRAIVLDDRIRSIAQQLLEADPIYFGCSSLQVGGKPAPAHWHKDNNEKLGASKRRLDWTTERFPIIRMGVYFQDHARHSNGLAIRVGSHRTASVRRGKPLIVPAEAGDVVAWTLTTTHSGRATRLKFAGSRAMGGRWMALVPERLKRPQAGERVAAFVTFGRESAHLDRFIEQVTTGRPDELEWYRKSHFGQDIWQLAKDKGLTVRSIVPEYGTPDPLAPR